MINKLKSSPLLLYLFGLTMLSITLGIQIIVLPWLVVDSLLLSSRWVGWIQAAVLLPNLFLLLLGGVNTDRRGQSRWPIGLLMVNAAIHISLAVIIQHQWLTFFLLALYAVLLGVTNAFIQPWKEYLLKKLNQTELQKAVAKSSLCLYGGQAVGVAVASSMASIGIEKLLSLQVVLVVLSVLSFNVLLQRFPKEPAISNNMSASAPQLLISGLREMWGVVSLRYLIGIVAFNGFFHIGVFIVALPVLVREIYHANVELFSGLQFAFVLGTIVATLIIIYRGFLDAPGKRIIFSLLYGGVILLAISAKPTLWGLYSLLFLWGVVVGVSSNMGRAVLQSLAPEDSRGRMISIYQLALFGCAPLGALFAGYVIEWLGVLQLLKVSGIASFGVFFCTLLTRELWHVEVLSTDNTK